MKPQTLVVKIGTSSLTNPTSSRALRRDTNEPPKTPIETATTVGQLALSTIASLVETLTELRSLGHRVILVSSGAVGVGCVRLNLSDRPRKMALKQAVAAVGQGRLIRVYDDLFNSLGQPIAQVLLTRRDLMERSSYVNIYNTLESLLELGVIPIVNENDTVAVEELKFGDNDTLSALVASLVEADWLFLLTDVDRLYSADPRTVPDAKPFDLVNSAQFAQLQVEAGASGSAWGTGGMMTKLAAARIATSAGVRTVITQGKQPHNLSKILQGESIGTEFEPQPRTDNARKRWIAHGLLPTGTLYLDPGAVKAICQRRKSLLAAGIARIEGEFLAAEAVRLCTAQGTEIARGIVNYSSTEIERIKGHHSEEIAELLGYAGPETVVHRDNLVLKEN